MNLRVYVGQCAADRVFGTNSGQREVFADAALPIVEGAAVTLLAVDWPPSHSSSDVYADVLEGFNGCLLAYGQTGAGKTHTMMGPSIDDEAEKVHQLYTWSLTSPSCVTPHGHAVVVVVMCCGEQGIIPRVIEHIFEFAARADER